MKTPLSQSVTSAVIVIAAISWILDRTMGRARGVGGGVGAYIDATLEITPLLPGVYGVGLPHGAGWLRVMRHIASQPGSEFTVTRYGRTVDADLLFGDRE